MSRKREKTMFKGLKFKQHKQCIINIYLTTDF